MFSIFLSRVPRYCSLQAKPRAGNSTGDISVMAFKQASTKKYAFVCLEQKAV